MRLPKKRDVNPPPASESQTFDSFDDPSEEIGSESYGHTVVPAGYAKRTGRWIAFAAVLVAVGLTCAFFAVSQIRAKEAYELERQTEKNESTLPLVDVGLVEAAPPFKTLILPAETAAWYDTTIYSRVNGYLADWKVDIGDRVKKNDVLATIDTPDLDSQLDAARAALKAAEAESKVKEADADFAHSSYDRWRDSPRGVVSDEEREAKKAGNDSSGAKLNASLAQIAVDQAKVDGLTKLAEYKNVTAPYDGVITDRRIDPGDLVTAGSSSSTTPLFAIQQADKIRVFANAPQAVASQLAVGSPVQVMSGDSTGHVYKGTIARMTGALNPKARTMRIEVVLPNPDYKLAPGMYVRVQLDVHQGARVRVPASALVFKANGPQVAVVDEKSRIEFRDVTIGTDDGDYVDLGSGVKAGESVVLNISNQISGGDEVVINKAPKAQS